MKTLSLFILALFVFVQCKKENRDPAPEVISIVGKWRVVEYKQIYGDSTVTQPVAQASSHVYEIRYDGVLLNGNGYVPCCIPSSYSLNGTAFVPKPAKPVELDPICSYALCRGCPEMKLTQTAPDSLVMETCEGSLSILVREK
ncbi:hypothetical protein [Dyadobacter sp. 22481]|uniref:hypothetical protein n=1 Tax=Dyadobacter sp. 22481 TaxID=3453926 RepID=UPI003F832DC8